MHFQNAASNVISPWHSVPLSAGEGLFNFVCEIPRNTRAKFEVATNEAGNPIKQDSKKGKPRSYAIDILWNYGMLPQVSHASVSMEKRESEVVFVCHIKKTDSTLHHSTVCQVN